MPALLRHRPPPHGLRRQQIRMLKPGPHHGHGDMQEAARLRLQRHRDCCASQSLLPVHQIHTKEQLLNQHQDNCYRTFVCPEAVSVPQCRCCHRLPPSDGGFHRTGVPGRFSAGMNRFAGTHGQYCRDNLRLPHHRKQSVQRLSVQGGGDLLLKGLLLVSLR